MKNKNSYFAPIVFHPGETLAEKLAEMNMGPKEFAVRTGKPEKTIIAVLNGNSSITPDMAIQFEQVTHIKADYWMKMQNAFNAYLASDRYKTIIADAIPWAKKFPLQEMMSMGWLPQQDSMEDRTLSLLSFFRLSSAGAWENYYCNQQLKVAFRISLDKSNTPFAISAWLRQGEIVAEEMNVMDYSAKKFKSILPKLQSLTALSMEESFDKIQKYCSSAGVKVMRIPSLKKTEISGATRWIKDAPCIQIADSLKSKNDFWFTFFHEVGHILLHGKKEIFLEKVAYSDWQKDKEEEADAFARKWLMVNG